ncbi:hypothetical protein [Flavobacterium sp.]|uniref:hypothetical protein n=1 Tax=Flavobacterium sp. TaxID=239 RepID=UPI002487AD2B|nr:hypothetical protein [Flavobacterium sp.]MDI1315755.1 hypothetical protein [Flavobacterium sp.]
MKSTPVLALLLFVIFLSSCGKVTNNDELNYVANIKSEEISVLNKIIINEKITEFIPTNLKDDQALCNYLISSDVSFGELNLKMFKLLDDVAAFKKEEDEVHKTDNSNPLSVGKGALNLGKMLAKGVWSGGRTLMSSGFLFDYKEDYNKFKETYNKSKLDSLKYVMHYISIKNMFEDEFNLKQTELIKTGNSVWSINLLPENITAKVNFEESLALYKKLKTESNRIIKVLLFNKMIKNDYTEQLDIQVKDLKYFWNSDQEIYENNFTLFEHYFKLLSDLKSKILQLKKDIEKSKNHFNDEILSNLNRQLEIYNKEVIQNINDLNINERIPSTEREINKKIKENSVIYFE